jgi:hypothetical protein
MNFFLKCFSIITDEITDRNSIGKSVGNKKIITEGYTDEIKRIDLFFYYRRKKNYRRKIHR